MAYAFNCRTRDTHPALGLADDPRHWSADDTVTALATFGDDLPGKLMVGEPAFVRFHNEGERVSQDARISAGFRAVAAAKVQTLRAL